MKITLECDHCTDHFTIIDDPIEFGDEWYPDLPRNWNTAWINGRLRILCPVGLAAYELHRSQEALEASRKLLPHNGRDIKDVLPWDG